MKLIAYIFLAFLIVSGSALAHHFFSGTNLSERKPILTQTYEIRGTKEFTEVSVTAKFIDLGDEKESFPQKVEFNGQLMRNEYLNDFTESENGCPLDNTLPVIGSAIIPKPQADKSIFSLLQKGYKQDNLITVYEEDGNSYETTISFEPVEFSQPDTIVLSRSKNNTVYLQGTGNANKELLSFVINQRGISADEKLFRYERANNLLFVPSESLKKLNIGTANIIAINGDGKVIESPGIVTGSS